MGKSFATMPDGSRIMVRAAYRAVDFTVPQAELDRFSTFRSGYGVEEIVEERDGELSTYHRIRDFERDGVRWTLLQHPQEYAIELELTSSGVGVRGLRCLPPLEAWDLTLELDRQETRYPIAIEDSWELSIIPGRNGSPG